MKNPPPELCCPKCNTMLRVTAEQAGNTTVCQRCGNEILVPGTSGPASGVTLEELIDLDDDIRKPAPPSSGDEVRAIDEPEPSASRPVADNDGTSDVPELADWPDADPPAVSGPAEAEGPPAQDVPSSDDVLPVNDDQADDDQSDDELYDLLPVDDPASPPPASTKDHRDPFLIDENAPLKIDGITPTDAEFPITCQLCGSLLYGRLSQVGTQIKCHDCHSLIDVVAPKKMPEVVSVEELPAADNDDENDGYQLEPAAELPLLETTIDQSLGEIDYDDDEFFERKREQDVAMSQTAGPVPVEPPLDDSPEYGLAPPDEDLLQPQKPDPGIPAVEEEPAPPPDDDTPIASPVGVVDRDTVRRDRQRPLDDDDWTVPESYEAAVRVAPEAGEEPVPRKRAPGEPTTDIRSPFAEMGSWLGAAWRVLRQPTTAVKIALCTLTLGFANLLITGAIRSFAEENTYLVKFGGWALLCLGIVPLVLTWFFIGIMANAVIRDAVERRNTEGEWPDFSISDLLAQFIYVATSFWLAAIPGLILGQVLWAVTDFAMIMPFCIVASSLMLTPLCLPSVIFNESPLSLVSSEALRSIRLFPNRWIRYWIAALLISVIFSAGIAGPLLGFIMCFVCPLIQVTLMIVCFWMIGDLSGYIVRYMEDQAAGD